MTDNLRGIAAMLASATGFVINDTMMKLATDELPTGELIAIRGVIATTLLGLAAWWFGAMRPASVLLQLPMLIRIFASALATLFIVAALRHLPLATVTSVLQVTPLAVTAGSAVLLGAAVGWRRWCASITGLAGILLIVKPGSEAFGAHAWIALVALMFTTARELTTRYIDHAVPSLYVAFASSAMITLAGTGLAPLEVWTVPSSRALALLTGAAIAVFCAFYFGVVAMRTGEIPVIMPFRYATILLALLLGYVFWAHVPDVVSFAGIALVCGAGLYLLMRERAAAARQAHPATSGGVVP